MSAAYHVYADKGRKVWREERAVSFEQAMRMARKYMGKPGVTRVGIADRRDKGLVWWVRDSGRWPAAGRWAHMVGVSNHR